MPLASRIGVLAENSPFDMKDHLKARGYRWSDGSDDRPKAWWMEVAGGEVAEENLDDDCGSCVATFIVDLKPSL